MLGAGGLTSGPPPFSLIFPGVRLSSDAQFSDFLDGLGPAQLVGRQTLATPPMGEKAAATPDLTHRVV